MFFLLSWPLKSWGPQNSSVCALGQEIQRGVLEGLAGKRGSVDQLVSS